MRLKMILVIAASVLLAMGGSAFTSMAQAAAPQENQTLRTRTNFNADWRFQLGPADGAAAGL